MGLCIPLVIIEQQLYAMHYSRGYGRELRKQKPLPHGADIQVWGEK